MTFVAHASKHFSSCTVGIAGLTAAQKTIRARFGRSMHHATPADFDAAGIAQGVPYDASPNSEWCWRIKQGLPVNAPRFQVGDWAYNSMAGENQKVLTVWYDAPIGGTRGGWRVNLPGFGAFDDNVSLPSDAAPFVEYVQTAPGSNCWQRAAQ